MDEELGIVLSLKQKQQMLEGLSQVRGALKGAGTDAQGAGTKVQQSTSKWQSLQQRIDGFSGATGRARKVSGALFGVLVANSQGALGPIGEVQSKLYGVGTALDDTKSKAAKWTIGLGAALTGVGAVLGTMYSKEQVAANQLTDAIAAAGGNVTAYEGRIKSAIKTGEHYGDTAARTQTALNRLVLATRNPAEAFKLYNAVLQISAARHMSVENVALTVGRALHGQMRSLQAFGIQVINTTKLQNAEVSAQKRKVSALAAVKKAQQNLADTEARITQSNQGGLTTATKLASAHLSVETAQVALNKATAQYGSGSGNAILASQKLQIAQSRYNSALTVGQTKGGLTLTQQIALRKAHESLAAAQEKVMGATKDQKSAQDEANKAGSVGDQIIQQTSKYMAGQASAAANSFTGHLHALAAVLDDKISMAGGHVYKMLTVMGPALMGVGAIIETGVVPKLFGFLLKITGVQKALDLLRASEVMTGEQSVIMGAEVETSSAEMSTAGVSNMARFGGAIAGVAGAIGTWQVARSTSGTGGAVASTLMGAVSGAAIGLSIGGPFGAAVGGAVGALAGLTAHFLAGAGAADKMNQATQRWMQTALQADNFAIGQQFNQQLLGQIKGNPDLARILATSGVKLTDIDALIRGVGPNQNKAADLLTAAMRSKAISTQDFQTAYDALQGFVTNFGAIADNVDNLATISGKVSQHTKDVITTTQNALTLIYSQPGAGGPSTYTPPTLGSLLSIPRHHRGGYNPIDAYVNMQPGEEIVHMPGGSTVVPIDNTNLAMMFGNGETIIPVEISLDGKVIAEATYRHTRNKAARQ